MRIGLHFLVVAGAVPAASYDSNGIMTKGLFKFAPKSYNNTNNTLIYLGDFSGPYKRGYFFIIGFLSNSPICAYIHYAIKSVITQSTKTISYLAPTDEASKSLKLYLKDGSLYLLTSNTDKASNYTIISNQEVKQTDLVLDETYEDVTPKYITP